MSEEITALTLADGLKDLYEQFTEDIRTMGKKHSGKRGSSRLGSSVLHWIAGSHVRTERDIRCDKFLEDVKSHLETFDYALEGQPEEAVREACFHVAMTMTEPLPADSNSTTVLMKRAVARYLIPYLPKLSEEQLLVIQERIKTAYPRNKRLPIENELLKEIRKLLKEG